MFCLFFPILKKVLEFFKLYFIEVQTRFNLISKSTTIFENQTIISTIYREFTYTHTQKKKIMILKKKSR